ncbi:MAG: dTDP-4-dehydrorhamnose reductase [Fimbriimonadaceae bacterium]|nr:dTDP-4-dehydrorhamnose reductase [Fimbriimonadaceae bacterium]
MKVLLLGAGGMLGQEVRNVFTEHGWEVWARDLPEFDLTNPVSVASVAVDYADADWCVNCAAYTAVDKAETERDAAFAVNAYGPTILADACLLAGTKLLHIGTDFVFDGEKAEPYTEDDEPNPLSAYGDSKREGEKAVLAGGGWVVRTSWLFGPCFNGGFPATMIRLAREGKPLRVVDDQFGTPTYTRDLALTLLAIMESQAPCGVYHAAGPEITTWRRLAEAAIREDRRQRGEPEEPLDVTPISTAEWPAPARRPRCSPLVSRKLAELGVPPMRPLAEALAEYVARRNA